MNKKLKRSLHVALITFISGSMTLAKAEGYSRVETGSIFSVIYSSSQGRALVGYTDRTGDIAHFADCSAPTTAAFESVDVRHVFDCKNVVGSSFIYNQENVEKIDEAFPAVFNEIHARTFRADAADANFWNVILFGVGTGVAGYFTSQTVAFTKNKIAAGQGMAAAAGVAGSIGVGAAAIGFAWSLFYVGRNAFGFATVPSIESKIIENYKAALSKSASGDAKIIALEGGHFVASFELLREAILRSVDSLSSL